MISDFKGQINQGPIPPTVGGGHGIERKKLGSELAADATPTMTGTDCLGHRWKSAEASHSSGHELLTTLCLVIPHWLASESSYGREIFAAAEGSHRKKPKQAGAVDWRVPRRQRIRDKR